jgi:hypothetical protein
MLSPFIVFKIMYICGHSNADHSQFIPSPSPVRTAHHNSIHDQSEPSWSSHVFDRQNVRVTNTC